MIMDSLSNRRFWCEIELTKIFEYPEYRHRRGKHVLVLFNT